MELLSDDRHPVLVCLAFGCQLHRFGGTQRTREQAVQVPTSKNPYCPNAVFLLQKVWILNYSTVQYQVLQIKKSRKVGWMNT